VRSGRTSPDLTGELFHRPGEKIVNLLYFIAK